MKDTKEYAVPMQGHWYSVITEGEFFPEANVLKITWQSDGLSDEDVKGYIKERFPFLLDRKILTIFHDEPWHFTRSGAAYGLIFIVFDSKVVDC